ncbi:MAG TPA: leucine-rich repeat domain-containing protein [Chitinophagaceae bacterium]|nr:leucine-rich repeat domain-containing protein [Chitinophagaceae bacterium]
MADSIQTPPEALQRIEKCINDKGETFLDLSELSLKVIPSELNNEELNHIEDLFLDSNQISEIQGLEKLPKLSYLNLSSNQIHEIKGLEKLTKLSNLVLWGNQISEIKGLEKLTTLSDLDLYNNQISEIKGLEKLTELSYVDLSENKIGEIQGLEKSTKLSNLNLSLNQIREIKGLEKLTKLSNLDLSFNQIRSIKGLQNLINLLELDLSYNQISKMDNLSIRLLEKLKKINLKNNPVKGVPFDDFSDKQAILGYIKSLQQQEKKATNLHLKLNIIGAGRIGKSQLLNYFDGKAYVEKEKETHGTKTSKYKIPGTDYLATIWDFGGQSYHHGFHYLFLRPKDFYVVLWRNNKETEQDYAYWLGTARHFAKEKTDGKYGTPLILVQNRWITTDYKDDKNFTPDEIAYPSSAKLQKYQLGLQDVFSLDVKSLFEKKKNNLQNQFFLGVLHEKMIAHCRQIVDLPEKFIEIKKILDDDPIMEINIKQENFKKVYAKDFEDSMFAYLLQYLEFTGNIICFREIESLKDYVFPNPPVLSDWIYQTVLNDDFKRNKNGKLSLEELKQKTGSTEKADIFINLMSEFRLIFKQPFKDEKDDVNDKYYIIPQFLAEYRHSFKQVLLELLPFTFSLQFADFIHEGRFFKFISEYGKYAKDNSAYWKYGLLFSYELNRDTTNKTEEQKKKDTLQVLAYYVTDKRQVMVHIEDKKGKTEVAKELFYFFALTEIPKQEKTKESEEEKQLKRRGPRAIIKELPGKIRLQDRLTPEILINLLQDDVQLCTNGYNYFDVKETIQNISVNNYFGTCTQTQARVKLDFMTINLLSTDNKRKLRVFFSYSHKDEIYKNELEKHFTMLKRNGRIETWHDRKILAGENWDNTIKQQLESADIVLLMISSDFLYSDYIWEQELGMIRDRYKKGDDIKAIPIFVRPCDTEGLDFMQLQGAQRDKQSIIQWISSSPDRDNTYTDIVKEIKGVIDSVI